VQNEHLPLRMLHCFAYKNYSSLFASVLIKHPSHSNYKVAIECSDQLSYRISKFT